MLNILPEEMHGRLFPYVTLGTIALNTLFFLVLHDRLNREEVQLADLESRTVRLAAAFPGTPSTPSQYALVHHFEANRSDEWNRLASPDRKSVDTWDSVLRELGPEEIEQHRAQLGRELETFRSQAAVVRFGFHPAYRSAWSYFTANFLHTRWTLFLFNMLFLWLAGSVLEDVWGHAIFAASYSAFCLSAVFIHSSYAESSFWGATGIVAALMGALLGRFPKTKIQRGTTWWSARPQMFRFKSPVYAILPLWLLGQAVWIRLVGQTTDVAYGTQAGAFAIGGVLAMLLRVTTIDRRVDQAIDTNAGGWSADPHIVKAAELLEEGSLDAAIAELKAHINERPASSEAHEMLPPIYLRKGDNFGYLAALEALCRVHLNEHKPEAAWQDYEDYSAAGGDRMPSATWLELCHIVEAEGNLERAASEFEALARTWPQDRTSVRALISAARVHLRLGHLDRAAELYKAAQHSSVPHQDWDETIQKGLERIEARKKGLPEPKRSPNTLSRV